VLAVMVACGAVVFGLTDAALAQSDELDGFTADHAAVQRADEEQFQAGVSADDVGALSRDLSRRPHVVGTEGQRQTLEYSLAKLRSYGLDAREQAYSVYEHFLDPGYLSHQASARASGVAALRFANADALPMRYSDYARAVDGYVAQLQEIQRTNPASAQVDLGILRDAAADWEGASERLESRAAQLLAAGTSSGSRLDRINRALMREERALIQSQGLSDRPWFRHQIYAPGINTGYAAQFLPGIRDALDAGDERTVRIYRGLLLDSLRNARAIATTAVR
jgi:hypothetical protein